MTARFLKIAVYGVLITPLVFSPTTFFPFLFPKALWFQAVVLAAVPLLLRIRPMSPIGPIGRALGALFIVQIIAAALGADPLRSFFGNEERMTGVLFSAHLFVFYMLCRAAFPDAASWRRPLAFSVLITTVVGLAGAVLVALDDRATGWLGFEPGGRIAGTIDNPAFYAATALVHAFLAGYLGATAATKRSRLGFVALAALLIVFVWFTDTRGALVGLAGALLVAASVWFFRKISRPVFVALLAFILGAFLYAAPDLYVRARASGGTITTRVLTWETALDAVRTRPLLGWGPENFHIPFNTYYQPEQLAFSYYETWFDRAHNIILDTLTQTGVVGLLALSALIVVAFRRTRTLPTAPRLALVGAFAGYLVQNLFLFDSVVPAITFIILLVTVESAPARTAVTSQRAIRQTAITATALAGALLALVAYVPTYAADAAAVRATALLQTDVQAGVRAFDRVFRRRLNIHLTEPRKELVLQAMNMLETQSLDSESRGALSRAAADAAARLTAEHPRDAYFLFLRGRVETARGEFDAAETAFAKALEFSPRRQQIIFGIAKLKFYEGKLPEVLPLLRAAVIAAPAVAEVHWQLGLMTLAANSSDPAGSAAIRRAVALGYQPKNDYERALIRELSGL